MANFQTENHMNYFWLVVITCKNVQSLPGGSPWTAFAEARQNIVYSSPELMNKQGSWFGMRNSFWALLVSLKLVCRDCPAEGIKCMETSWISGGCSRFFTHLHTVQKNSQGWVDWAWLGRPVRAAVSCLPWQPKSGGRPLRHRMLHHRTGNHNLKPKKSNHNPIACFLKRTPEANAWK